MGDDALLLGLKAWQKVMEAYQWRMAFAG